MSNRLAEICAKKAEHVAKQRQMQSIASLQELAAKQETPRGFESALRQTSTDAIALIAEIKKASPSKGVIRESFNPENHAQDYQKAGATCLSVLTDQPYFQGDDSYISLVKEASSLPVLRKDFMIEPYQIVESRALGADCVLLIMAALEDNQSKELESAALELGMDVLIEVHDEAECERAIQHLSSTLLGINNRNLKTLEVSLETGKAMAKNIPKDYFLVCESGIASHSEITDMLGHGFSAFLVGESLMRQDDLANATRKLLKG